MQTTTLIAELLVIGSISLIWVIPILEKVLKKSYSVHPNFTEDVIFYVALIYFLGILVNLLSDMFFHYIDKKIANKYTDKENLQKIRCKILTKSTEAGNYLLTRRSIVRILRSTSFNFILILLLSLISIYEPYVNLNATQLFFILFVFNIFLFYGYVRSLKGYYKYLLVTEEILKNGTDSKTKN